MRIEQPTVMARNEAAERLFLRLQERPNNPIAVIQAALAEAAMNGWNLHVEQMGEPNRAAFMEGFRAAIEQLRERLADQHNLHGSEQYRLDEIYELLDQEAARD